MKSARRSGVTESVDKVMGAIAWVMDWIGYAFASLFQSPKVRAAILGILTLLFLMVNVESYFIALPGEQLPFLPKPYIDDGASLRYFPIGSNFLLFLLALVVASGVQGIQSHYWDKKSKPVNQRLNQAKYEYERVKDFKKIEPPSEAHNVATAAANRYNRISSGLSRVGWLVMATFIFDLVNGLQNYNPFGSGVSSFFFNLIYLVISVVGTDYMGAMYMQARDEAKRAKA